MTEEQIAKVLNDYAEELPSYRSLQQVVDALTQDAREMLISMLDATKP